MANKYLFTDTGSLYMSLDPLSDDDVDQDGSSYVRARSRVDSAVRKAKAPLKTLDHAFSGYPADGVPSTGIIRPFANVINVDGYEYWGGTVSWVPFIPDIGTGSDDLTGGDTCIVDGIKIGLSCFLPKNMFTLIPNYDAYPRQRVFLELLYVPDVPPVSQDVSEIQLGEDYFRNYLYESSLTVDQVWNVFLKKSAIRDGVKSLKRWSFDLNREVVTGRGRHFEGCVWYQMPTSSDPLGSEGYSGAGVVGTEPQYMNTNVGKLIYNKNYQTQTEQEQLRWGPTQTEYWQTMSIFSDNCWVPVNRTVQVNRESSDEVFPSQCLVRGMFVVAAWSDVQVTLAGVSVDYSEIPQVEMNMRFKFHQKN